MGRVRAHFAPPNRVQILRLQENHREILRLKVAGVRPGVIARRLGIGENQVSNICNSELGLAKLRELSDSRDRAVKNGSHMVDLSQQVNKRINKIAPVAVARLEKLLADDRTSDGNIIKVAQDLLDRSGHSAIKKTMNAHATIPCDSSFLADLKERAAVASGVPQEPAAQREILDIEQVSEAQPSSGACGGLDPCAGPLDSSESSESSETSERLFSLPLKAQEKSLLPKVTPAFVKKSLRENSRALFGLAI